MTYRIKYSNYLLMFALILSGCASIPKEFVPFVEQFRADSGNTASVDIEFGEPHATELSAANLGECVPGSSVSTPIVIVRETYWRNATVTSKKALIYHELVHCLIHRGHTLSGLMQPSLITDAEFLKLNLKKELNNE